MFEELTITEQENSSGGKAVLAVIALVATIAFFCYELGKD